MYITITGDQVRRLDFSPVAEVRERITRKGVDDFFIDDPDIWQAEDFGIAVERQPIVQRYFCSLRDWWPEIPSLCRGPGKRFYDYC